MWCGPNAVNAAAGAGHHVLRALDGNALAKNGPENFHFRVAELGTHVSGCGDRAVVLDQQERSVTLALQFGHEAFFVAEGNQSPESLLQRSASRDAGTVGLDL